MAGLGGKIFGAAASVVLASMAASAQSSSPSAADNAPSIAEISAYVRAAGWPVELGYMCTALKINIGPRCAFLQIAVHNKQAAGGDHGFNVPADGSASADVLLYHVTPLTGEFFLAAADGGLKTALYRSRGAAFEAMPPEQASASYARELTFWQANFRRIANDVGRQRPAAPSR